MLGVAEQRAYTAEMVHRHTRATPPRWGAREQKFAFVRDAVGREAAEAHVTSRHVTRIVFTGVKAEVLAQIRHHRLCRSGQTPSPGRARAIGGAVGCLRGADKPLTPAWARHSRRNPEQGTFLQKVSEAPLSPPDDERCTRRASGEMLLRATTLARYGCCSYSTSSGNS